MKKFNCPDCPMNEGLEIDVCGLCKRANAVPAVNPCTCPSITLTPAMIPAITPIPYYPGDFPVGPSIICKINND